MGHDEPLLRLVRGAWILLAKAQADLVLRLRATILQVGLQFYRHRDRRGWAKMKHPTWCPPVLISLPISPLCTHSLSPLPRPDACLMSHICAHFQCSCPMPCAPCSLPTPCPWPFIYAYLVPSAPVPTICYDNTCPSPMHMPHTQCPNLPCDNTSHTPMSISVPSYPYGHICSHFQSVSCPLFQCPPHTQLP